MGKVLALVDDLVFQSKLVETARQVRVELKVFASGEQFVAEALALTEAEPGQNSLTLLLVDLNTKQAPLDAIRRLRATGLKVPIVAFLSHVQVDLAEHARAAGCSEVLPRSTFAGNVAAILSRAKSEGQQGL